MNDRPCHRAQTLCLREFSWGRQRHSRRDYRPGPKTPATTAALGSAALSISFVDYFLNQQGEFRRWLVSQFVSRLDSLRRFFAEVPIVTEQFADYAAGAKLITDFDFAHESDFEVYTIFDTHPAAAGLG